MAFGAGAFGDFIILRSDGVAGYNFAVVVDDRDMAITHVIRGDDHLTNTARQLAVFAALGARPPAYAHHGMIHDPEGGKLSKRLGATAVGEFREAGYLPEALVNYLALLSWSHGDDEVLDRERLAARVRAVERSRRARRRSTRRSSTGSSTSTSWRSTRTSTRVCSRSVCRPTSRRRRPPPWRRRTSRRSPPTARRRPSPPPSSTGRGSPPRRGGCSAARARSSSSSAAAARDAADWLAPNEAREAVAAYRAWGKERGITARDLLMPLRVALTGREHGPELHFVLAALERRDALDRLDDALAAASAGPAPPSTEGDPT